MPQTGATIVFSQWQRAGVPVRVEVCDEFYTANLGIVGSDCDGNSRCATSLLHSHFLHRTPPLHTTSWTPLRSMSSPFLEGNSRG